MEKIKYHPILFSTPMVQAILEGRKTQTRRTKGLEAINETPDLYRYDGFNEEDGTHCVELLDENGNYTERYKEIECSYNVGDILWGRESFHYVHDSETNQFLRYGYKADKDYPGAKWKPSIFMPKQVCRIFLKIKSIRAERLQDINEEDSKAEGANPIVCQIVNDKWNQGYSSFFEGFKKLWQSINGMNSWDDNPFVWVYEFERIEKPNDFT